jgi:uncharacterized membrane protein YhhN
LVIYLLVLTTEILAEHTYAVTKDFTFLAIMQPILVPVLIGYLIYACRGRFDALSMGVLAGLCFDWIGDVILTIHKDTFNLPGMFGYFAGHVCYAIAFGVSIVKSGYKVSIMNRFVFSLPPIFYIIIYYIFIYNYISTHQVNNMYIIPVALYALSIMAMATSALWRMGTTTDVSFWCVSSGALFYMLSDSITGYNHFVEPISYRYVATMGTYGISLLLFTVGAILHQAPVSKQSAN